MSASRILAASILAVSAVGCMSVGRTIDRAEVGTIRTGETTKDEMVARFGAPVAQYYGPDGFLAMNWMHTHVGPLPGQIDVQTLSVQFDDNGVVKKYSLAGNWKD